MRVVCIKCRKNRLHVSKVEVRGAEQRQTGTQAHLFPPFDFRKRNGLKPDLYPP